MGRFTLFCLFLAVSLIIGYLLFGLTPYIVAEDSMDPNLKEGDVVLVDRLLWRLRRVPKEGVITFYTNGKTIIKRVVLVEEQSVKIDENYGIYIHGEYLPLNPNLNWSIQDGYLYIPKDNYFMLGDNLAVSLDSRHYGLIDKKYFNGAVLGVLYHENRN